MPKVAGKHYAYTKIGKKQADRARSRIRSAAMKKSAKRITKKRPRGRPVKYQQADGDRVEDYALVGMTDDEIAVPLG